MKLETKRIELSPSWVSCGEFVEENPTFEWLSSKCQQYALSLSCFYRGDNDTYGSHGKTFDWLTIVERLRLLDYEGCTYWYILHDEDKYTAEDAPDPAEIGRLKPAHIHLVVDFHREVRAYTAMRLICRLFGQNPEQNQNPAECPDVPVFVERPLSYGEENILNPWLNIKPLRNLVGMLAYIVHETRECKEKGKTHYLHNRVVSNDIETFESACTLNAQGIQNITPSNLIHLVKICDYKTSKILNLLGINDYLSLRMIIRDLQQERM